MKLSELTEKLGCRVLTASKGDPEIMHAYTSDLLSDMMGNAEDGAVLITIQAHKNTIAVASQLESPAVILCNKRSITPDVEEAALKNGVAVLQAEENQFIVSGKLYMLLHG